MTFYRQLSCMITGARYDVPALSVPVFTVSHAFS